jgi:putative PIN family toxin of toxin-antitoxin system
MGTALLTPAPPRTVLDTNLVLSALVFSTGNLVTLRREWQSRRFTPLVSKATAGELIRVLAYPKFRLKAEEREHLLSDYLPFCETIQVSNPPPPTPPCRDPFDVAFLELAVAGKADFLVTGDQDLLSLAPEFTCPIVNAARFLKHLESA